MVKTIKLSNDAVYQVDRCGASDGFLWIQFVESVELEDITGHTDRIVYEYGSELSDILEGYTQLFYIEENTTGTLMSFSKEGVVNE